MRFGATLSMILALALPLPCLAQSADGSELSAEELRELFSKQKDRGLVLAPVEGDTAASSSDATQSGTTITSAEPAYSAVDSGEAVNIQIRFDFDSSALRPDQKPKLATLCEVMRSVDVQVFQVVGHTDNSGSDSYNRRLSQLRADEVKRHLVNDCGIAAQRLQAIGVGEEFPLLPDDPGADSNRRVEFQALG